MSIDFKLPELGENITSGDVVNVLVKPGDTIVGNQPVIELETDKAVVEIPCPHAGKIVIVHVTKGQRIEVSQTIVSLEGEGAAPVAEESPAAKPKVEKTTSPEKRAAQSLRDEAKPAAAPPRKTEQAAAPPTATAPAPPTDTSLLPAGPHARRLARELGVDLRRLQGTGQRGRITPEDRKSVV